MESKTLEAAEARGGAAAPAAREAAGDGGAEGADGSCCILKEVVREGRVMTVCVATCCGADVAE